MLIVGIGECGAVTTSCPDCYRCSAWAGSNCTNCVYDQNYCSEIDIPDPDPEPDLDCSGYATLDSSLGKCVCDSANISVKDKSCSEAWTFWDGSDDYCDCRLTVCISGQYPTDNNKCTDCPVPDFTLKSGSIESSVNYADDKSDSFSAFEGEKNGCYIPGGSTATDSSGTFEITSNCFYSLSDVFIGFEPLL